MPMILEVDEVSSQGQMLSRFMIIKAVAEIGHWIGHIVDLLATLEMKMAIITIGAHPQGGPEVALEGAI